MKKIIIFTLCFYAGGLSVSAKSPGVSPEIGEYIDYIQTRSIPAVDYVMGLFETNDVVIIGERDHRDTTQYELIGEIFSDPRFIQRVGLVLTETGSMNYSEDANRILKADSDGEVFRKELLALLRETSYYPIWEKSNFYLCLNRIRRVNQDLPSGEKLTVGFLDVPFSWQGSAGQSHEDYWKFYREKMPRRDRIMGENAVRFISVSPKGKALVILNSPHSYQFYENKYGREMAAQFIFDAFPGKVANVMVNWVSLSKSDRDGRDKLIDRGKWDAAFAACGFPAVGFDLKNSPFGETRFHDMDKPLDPIRYEDVYTGFIYYLQPSEWVWAMGVPGIMDDDFGEEYVRRVSVFQRKELRYSEARIGRYNKIETGSIYGSNSKMRRQIKRFYKNEV